MYGTDLPKVTIYLRFAFIVTIFDIFKLIIKLDDRPFETGGYLGLLQRIVTCITCYVSVLLQCNLLIQKVLPAI